MRVRAKGGAEEQRWGCLALLLTQQNLLPFALVQFYLCLSQNSQRSQAEIKKKKNAHYCYVLFTLCFGVDEGCTKLS